MRRKRDRPSRKLEKKLANRSSSLKRKRYSRGIISATSEVMAEAMIEIMEGVTQKLVEETMVKVMVKGTL